MRIGADVMPHVLTYVETRSYFVPLRFLLVVLQVHRHCILSVCSPIGSLIDSMFSD
jgi:hypothetical protein